MKSNLEDISYESVCSPAGISYRAFRQTLQPRYGKVWLHIGLGFLFLLLPFAIGFVAVESFPVWSFPFIALYVGYVLAYLHLFIHEAAHYNIHPSKKQNDLLANSLLCPLFGLDMKKYRKIHWQHHLHLATPKDQEVSYFNALSLSFLWQTITGWHTLRILRSRSRFSGASSQPGPGYGVLRFALAQLIFITLAWLGGGWVLVLGWLIAVGLVFPFFATLRQILEHRDEEAHKNKTYYTEPRSRISRLFGRDLFAKTFGGAGFNQHLLHHWDPQISYTRLDDILHFLQQCGSTSEIVAGVKTSYSRVFLKLFFVR